MVIGRVMVDYATDHGCGQNDQAEDTGCAQQFHNALVIWRPAARKSSSAHTETVLQPWSMAENARKIERNTGLLALSGAMVRPLLNIYRNRGYQGHQSVARAAR